MQPRKTGNELREAAEARGLSPEAIERLLANRDKRSERKPRTAVMGTPDYWPDIDDDDEWSRAIRARRPSRRPGVELEEGDGKFRPEDTDPGPPAIDLAEVEPQEIRRALGRFQAWAKKNAPRIYKLMGGA